MTSWDLVMRILMVGVVVLSCSVATMLLAEAVLSCLDRLRCTRLRCTRLRCTRHRCTRHRCTRHKRATVVPVLLAEVVTDNPVDGYAVDVWTMPVVVVVS